MKLSFQTSITHINQQLVVTDGIGFELERLSDASLEFKHMFYLDTTHTTLEMRLLGPAFICALSTRDRAGFWIFSSCNLQLKISIYISGFQCLCVTDESC